VFHKMTDELVTLLKTPGCYLSPSRFNLNNGQQFSLRPDLLDYFARSTFAPTASLKGHTTTNLHEEMRGEVEVPIWME